MAYSTSMNNGATPTAAVTAGHKAIRAQNVNWAVDWSTVAESADRVLLRNVLAPFGSPNEIRIERSRINNIYQNTSILPNYQLPTKRGIKLFLQVTNVASITDSDDVMFRAELPYSASVTLRVPTVSTDLISYAQIYEVLSQLFGSFFQTDAQTASTGGLQRFLATSINPTKW